MTRELPVVCESSNSPSGVTLIADLRVRGVWQSQVDVHVVDMDAFLL